MIALGAAEMLGLLAAAPLAGIAFWRLWRSRRLALIAVRREGGGPVAAGARHGSRSAAALIIGALVLLAVAAARPQIERSGPVLAPVPADVVVALDVSQSMAARDAEPSRWEAAAGQVRALLDARRGRRAGLVIFAGDAYVRFPLTRDIDSAISVLDALRPGESLVPPGSDPAAAIEAAAGLLDGSGAIILVGDGESHGRDSEAVAAAGRAADEGIRIYAAAVGSAAGAVVPLGSGALKIDARNGEPAVSSADPDALRAIAAAGGGRFVDLSAGQTLGALAGELNALDAGVPRETADGPAARELFPWFAAAALVLLIAATAVRVIVIRGPGAVAAPQAAIVLIAALATLAVGCAGSPAGSAIAQGNGAFADGRYEEALEHYREAQRAEPGNAAAHLNAGKALHALERYSRAEIATARALESDDAVTRARAWYQIGNHRTAVENYIGARLAYIEALRADPELTDAKINLEIVNALLMPPEPPPEPTAEGEPGESDAQSVEGGAAEEQAEQSAREAAPGGEAAAAESGEQGSQGSGDPAGPTYEERAGRAEATAELREALDRLPLENATPEQALAVLDALRAVPGQPLTAGAGLEESGIDDW